MRKEEAKEEENDEEKQEKSRKKKRTTPTRRRKHQYNIILALQNKKRWGVFLHRRVWHRICDFSQRSRKHWASPGVSRLINLLPKNGLKKDKCLASSRNGNSPCLPQDRLRRWLNVLEFFCIRFPKEIACDWRSTRMLRLIESQIRKYLKRKQEKEEKRKKMKKKKKKRKKSVKLTHF